MSANRVEAIHCRKCPICGSTEIEDIIPRANDHITGDFFQILGCRSCEVCFTYPAPDDMEPYYPSKYRGYGPFVMRLLRTFYSFRVGKWTRMIGRPGAALEIGCGAGLMLDALRLKGWQVMGVERTEAMASYARDTLGLNVITGGLEAIPKKPCFDLIILFQVLEHLHNPFLTLKECAARLKPGGLVIINVPNIDSLQARCFGPLWLHLDPPRHLFHFSPNSLANIVRMAGLEVSNVSFVSLEHDPYGWVQSTINRITGSYNVLTRYLMGIEVSNRQIIISVILGALLAVPSVILSMITWIIGRGALMQIVATAPIKHGATNRNTD